MIHTYFGGEIDLDPADGAMYELQAQGRWEWRKCELMHALLKPGMRFVDAGAYNGYFTLIAAKLVGEEGRVWAFEPDAHSWRVLVANVTRNHYLQVLFPRMALADFTGNAELFQRDHPSWSSLIALGQPSASVPVTRLDIVARRGQSLDLIKIDVEGAEAAVLRGAAEILHQRESLTLLMDLHPELGADPQEVERILKEAGFALFDIRSDCAPMDTIPPSLVELMAVRQAFS